MGGIVKNQVGGLAVTSVTTDSNGWVSYFTGHVMHAFNGG